MNPELDLLQAQTRRHFLRQAGQFSLGAVILPLHDPVMVAEQIAMIGEKTD